MIARRPLACVILSVMAATAWAHRAPNSVVSLDFTARSVHAELRVPQSELDYAEAAEIPGENFPTYLLRHVAVETPGGVRWRVELRSVRRADVGGHDCWVALLDLVPPPGSSTRDLVFIDDAVTHEVRNHVVTVLARSDAAAADDAPPMRVLGLLQFPARRLEIHLPAPAQNSHWKPNDGNSGNQKLFTTSR
jgi:hypothetical protein